MISLLTPVDPDRAKWLPDLATDVEVLRAMIGRGHDVEWVVCVDGAGDVALPRTDSALRLPLAGGPAAARTAALMHSSGTWVLPVDADDRLDVGGTVAFIEEILALDGSECGWAGAGRTLLDGSSTAHTVRRRRQWSPGALAEEWTSPFPFHPNTVAIHRPLALACGGWPALPVNEDLALVLACSEDAPGQLTDHLVTRYRAWGGQMVNSSHYTEAKRLAFMTIEALVNARRTATGRSPITAPASGGAHGRAAR